MFWKKKEKKESTNPFEAESQPSSPAPSYTSHQPQQQAPPPQQDYNSGGRYGSRYASNETENRNQLMGGRSEGFNSREEYGRSNDSYQSRSERRNYPSEDRYGNGNGGSGHLYGNGDDEDDEEVQVAGMKQQMKNIKQDSLASTRAALQKIHETEATAANTMNMLGQQSTQIANVNRHLDMSKAYSDKAANSADELKQLNRSIFIPVVSNPFRRKERERKELERLQSDHAEHMAERDNIRQFEYESNARIQETARANSGGRSERRGRSEADRRRYQFEEDSEDDRVEDELDDNLDLLGDAVGRLKNMAVTMNTELDSQNRALNKTIDKVDPLSRKLISTTDKLNRTK